MYGVSTGSKNPPPCGCIVFHSHLCMCIAPSSVKEVDLLQKMNHINTNVPERPEGRAAQKKKKKKKKSVV